VVTSKSRHAIRSGEEAGRSGGQLLQQRVVVYRVRRSGRRPPAPAGRRPRKSTTPGTACPASAGDTGVAASDYLAAGISRYPSHTATQALRAAAFRLSARGVVMQTEAVCEQPRNTRKLRVVGLSAVFSPTGGAERLAAQLAARLDTNRFERIACSTRWRAQPSLDGELQAAGVRVLRLDRCSRRELRAWWPLISLLRDERIDILHSHGSSNAWGAILGRLAGVPVVIAHEHRGGYDGQLGPSPSPFLRRLIDRQVIARGADLILAVSNDVRRRMIENDGIEPHVVRVLPNGIPAFPPPSGRDVRRELGIPLDVPVLGTVCIMRREKALDVLIRSAALLAPLFPGLKVLIVGHGPEEANVQALIHETGLEQTVLLLGRSTHVPDVLAAVDVAVISSDWEGSPLSVIEYMAAGKPVVATRVGGVPDLIEHGVEGLLVDRRDAQGLAEAVARLLRDPALRVQMGARGRQRQRREFDIDTMVRRVEVLYEELFRRTKRARKEGWEPQPTPASSRERK
jgi:glycosyltransferase involved in cell wall biosynthesis